MKEPKVSIGHVVLAGDESPRPQSGTHQLHLPRGNAFCFGCSESKPLKGNVLGIQTQCFVYLRHKCKTKQAFTVLSHRCL